MKLTDTIKSDPITVQKTTRPVNRRVMTSCFAGVDVPVVAIGVQREERVSNMSIRVKLDMNETTEMLFNAVNVHVQAWWVPQLAFDRFSGMDSFNRSYGGVAEPGGGVIPFFDQIAFDQDAPFWKTLGIHAPQGAMVNSQYLEAYNTLVNFRRKARSEKLALRLRHDTSLAQAFWHHTDFAHIVPDFDQAMIDGIVPLSFADSKARVTGLGVATAQVASGSVNVRESGNPSTTYAQHHLGTNIKMKTITGTNQPDVFTELADAGITVSLANIEMAKEMASFAKLRKQYNGLDDDHIIDLLMDGIRVPEEALNQPMLLDRGQTIFGYNRRYATDAGNLAQSVTQGETFVDLRLRTPAMNTGGTILVIASITPDQLFERQEDPFLFLETPQDLPQFVRDFGDPEKVSIVKNRFIDVKHTDPNGTFGYAPLNHQWKTNPPNIGGKYYRPNPNAGFNEERQKIWAVETIDPSLTEDFYIVGDIHHEVFADTLSDPFEITARTTGGIIGNTVYGKGLEEDTGEYDYVVNQIDTTRIDQDAD